jgi:hypothetical protein
MLRAGVRLRLGLKPEVEVKVEVLLVLTMEDSVEEPVWQTQLQGPEPEQVEVEVEVKVESAPVSATSSPLTAFSGREKISRINSGARGTQPGSVTGALPPAVATSPMAVVPA